jgi:hypothetical protein
MRKHWRDGKGASPSQMPRMTMHDLSLAPLEILSICEYILILLMMVLASFGLILLLVSHFSFWTNWMKGAGILDRQQAHFVEIPNWQDYTIHKEVIFLSWWSDNGRLFQKQSFLRLVPRSLRTDWGLYGRIPSGLIIRMSKPGK